MARRHVDLVARVVASVDPRVAHEPVSCDACGAPIADHEFRPGVGFTHPKPVRGDANG